MTSVKDLERCTRLYEKEIAILTDQLTQKESSLRREVDGLRLSLEAVTRYLSEKDPSFGDAFRVNQNRLRREGGEPGGK